MRPPQPGRGKDRLLMLAQDAGGVDVFHQLTPQFTPPHIRTKTREHALRLYGFVDPRVCGPSGLWPFGSLALQVLDPNLF